MTRPDAQAVGGPEGVPFGQRQPKLDGLRGFAVLLVLICHGFHYNAGDGWLGQLVTQLPRLGWCGVDLFFVLSGFLITGILLDSRGGDGYFRNFYCRRALRILPLYYAAVAGVLFVAPALHHLSGLTSQAFGECHAKIWDGQFFLWTHTQNYLQATAHHTLPGLGHFWTLAIEEQFYLLWPAIVWAVKPRHFLKACIGLVVGVLVLRCSLALVGVDGWAIVHWTFTRLDALVMGGIAASVARSPSALAACRPQLGRVMWGSGAFVVGIFVSTGSFHLHDEVVYTLGFTLLSLFFAAWTLALATSPEGAGSSWIGARGLRGLGKLGYGVYVFHYPFALAIARGSSHLGWLGSVGLLPSLARLLLIVAVGVGAAWISWHLWEKHWLGLKRFFRYRPGPVRPAGVSGRQVGGGVPVRPS